MRNFKSNLLFLLFAVFSFADCNESSKDRTEKVTDIPVTTKSADAKTSFQQGLMFSDEANIQKAREAFTRAIAQDSTLAIAYLYRSNTASTPKEYADDVTKAKAHLDGVSDWEKMYYDYENTFLTGDYNKRIEIAEKIASTYPDAARAQVDLGTTYLGANDFAKARDHFQKATQLDPKWIGGFNSLVGSYLFNDPKDFKKAEENALKSVELSPKSAASQIALGDVYRAENDMQKAKDAYSKAITLDPTDFAGYYKRGHANSFLGNYDEARQDYTKGSTLDSIKSNAVFNIANTYLYAGDSKMASKYLMGELMKADSSSDPHDKKTVTKMTCLNSCAMIALHDGDATGLLQAATMMQPLSDEIANDVGTNEGKLQEKANMLYWQSLADAAAGNYDAAKSKADGIKTTLDPIKDPLKLQGYDFVMGYISMKQKNYPDAVNHFEKADPTSMFVKYHLAMVNEAAGNKDKANTMYKEIANYNFNDVGYALVRNEVKKKVTP